MLTELMKIVVVTENDEMSRIYPDGAPCRIEVTLKDGRQVSGERSRPKGDPKDPMSDNEIEEKARKNMAYIMDDNMAENIITRIWNLEKEERIDWLAAPLKQQQAGRGKN